MKNTLHKHIAYAHREEKGRLLKITTSFPEDVEEGDMVEKIVIWAEVEK